MQDTKNSRWIDFLEEDDLAFIKRFVLFSGSLKDLAAAYNVTYPTLRLRLDRLIAKIQVFDSQKIEDDYERLLRGLFAATVYAIIGKIKYESVEGDGFLEMWNYFPPAKPGSPEEKYFSRTLGESGPMGKITGSSDWRVFKVPFNRTGTSNAPARLQF